MQVDKAQGGLHGALSVGEVRKNANPLGGESSQRKLPPQRRAPRMS